ncbi:hypothetical protein EDD85DRAFT_796541 [Armillaria nabsnona]|nr:hypothetical protein EDD85DRAFT_796541 [Armillaria nabsnona]
MIARTYPGTDIPELTDSQIKDIFHDLDMQFNEVVLQAVTHASRNNIQSPGRPRFLILVILLLYILATFSLYEGWALEIAYITLPNGESFWTAFKYTPGTPIFLTQGVDAILSTILADTTLAWDSIFVFLYGAVGLSGGGHGALCLFRLLALPWQQARFLIHNSNDFTNRRFFDNVVNWAVLYSSLILATFLWCTILIVYRIMRVGGAAGRMHVYQRVIEMLVESAFLYSAVLVVLVVLEARNERAADYIEGVAAATRGIMPTILVGRVAAGHARPDDSWSEHTTASSIQFRNHSSSQNDTLQFRSHSSSQSVSLAGSESGRSTRITPDLENALDTLEDSARR